MQLTRFVIVMLGAFLTGCGLWGPNYTKPDMGVLQSWSSRDNLSSMNTNADLPDTAWWRKFNDPKLNQLIAESLKYNNNIQLAIGNVIQAQGNLELVDMGWVPTAPISATTYGVSGGSQAVGNDGVSSISSGSGQHSGYRFGLTPSYSLNILQQLRMQEAAKAQLMQAQYTKDAMRLTIISQVAGSYFTLSEQNYQLELQKTLVSDTGKLYELAQGQYKDGYISLLTLQTYLQNYQIAKAQVPIIENNIVASENSLQVLVNKNPGKIKMGSSFIETPMLGIIPANLPSTVLKQRPDVLQAEQALIVANANIGVATSFFFPTIDLTSGIGTTGSDLFTLLTGSSDWWTVQAGIHMPILNLAQFGAIKGAKGAYYTAYYQYMLTVKQAFQQVDNGLSSHQKITDSYNEQLKMYNSTVVAYKLSNDSFKDGLFSELQLLNSRVTMENAGISLASVKLQQLQSIVYLYQSLAGGYKVNDKDGYEPLKFGDSRDSGTF